METSRRRSHRTESKSISAPMYIFIIFFALSLCQTNQLWHQMELRTNESDINANWRNNYKLTDNLNHRLNLSVVFRSEIFFFCSPRRHTLAKRSNAEWPVKGSQISSNHLLEKLVWTLSKIERRNYHHFGYNGSLQLQQAIRQRELKSTGAKFVAR